MRRMSYHNRYQRFYAIVRCYSSFLETCSGQRFVRDHRSLLPVTHRDIKRVNPHPNAHSCSKAYPRCAVLTKYIASHLVSLPTKCWRAGGSSRPCSTFGEKRLAEVSYPGLGLEMATSSRSSFQAAQKMTRFRIGRSRGRVHRHIIDEEGRVLTSDSGRDRKAAKCR